MLLELWMSSSMFNILSKHIYKSLITVRHVWPELRFSDLVFRFDLIALSRFSHELFMFDSIAWDVLWLKAKKQNSIAKNIFVTLLLVPFTLLRHSLSYYFAEDSVNGVDLDLVSLANIPIVDSKLLYLVIRQLTRIHTTLVVYSGTQDHEG